MRRSVPHYTCKNVEESGAVCAKVLLDYLREAGIFEKKPDDLSAYADGFNASIAKKSAWKMPILYDLAFFLSKSGAEVLIVKEKDDYVKEPNKNIEEYGKDKEKECLKLGVKQEIDENIEAALMEALFKSPVLLFINANFLYKQKDAGLSWIIVTEYNKSLDEFIVYDPMYYTKIPKTRDWERIVNTPKRRYISFRSKYFLNCWKKTSETVIYGADKRANSGVKPFFREFLAIAKTDR